MNAKRPCMWNDKHYPSISAAALDLGVSGPCLIYRLNKGYTCDDDLQHRGYAQDVVRKKTIWNGVEYSSRVEAAHANNKSLTVLNYQLNKHHSSDNDIYQSVTWNGITYNSYKEAAKALGITSSTLYRRISRGYTSDNDVRTHNEAVIWNDKEYSSAVTLAKALGISPQAVRQRFEKGYTCDEDMKWTRKG